MMNEYFQDFTLDFYFRTFWNDPRLAFEKTADIKDLTMGHDVAKLIWLPDLFFVQDKQNSFMHTITTKNEFVKIDYKGNVTRSIRYQVMIQSLTLFDLITLNIFLNIYYWLG